MKKNANFRASAEKNYAEQQQFIRYERQRISGEIHDDIGSGLFAIQLFVDTVSKQRTDVQEVKQISLMLNEMSSKIHEIIWSTNTESDNLENLLYYIEFQTTKLFENTDIEYKPDFPLAVPNLSITSQSRRNTYLLVKEIVYNAIKHSKGNKVSLTVNIGDDLITFTTKDNGIGFDPKDIRPDAMGLKNIKSRIEMLKGELTLESHNGSTWIAKIPLVKGLGSKVF